MIVKVFVIIISCMYCQGSEGVKIQSFFPIVAKEASQYDNQFQQWDSEFQPHEIGQIPLVGYQKPNNNLFYEIIRENSGELNVNETRQNKQINYITPNSKLQKTDNKHPTLSVDDRSVSYDGWSVLTTEDKNRIDVDSQNTLGNDDLHPVLRTPTVTTHSPVIYRNYNHGRDVINNSLNKVNKNIISYEQPWKRKRNRNRFNAPFLKHRRRKTTVYGRKKPKPWHRKKEMYRPRRQRKVKKYPKLERSRRRHQMYEAHPQARQLNTPIGVSFGISTPIKPMMSFNEFQNSPMRMRNAVKRTGGVLSKAKSAFKGVASSWRNTVDGTANTLTGAWQKTLRRVSHGYRKMGRKRHDRLKEYNVGYEYPKKPEMPLVHNSMDYAINFTPIQSPYNSDYDGDDDSNLINSSKYDYDLYGNFVGDKEYLDHVMVEEKETMETTTNTHANPKTRLNHGKRRPSLMSHTTTPHSVGTNLETPFNSHLFEQTPFLKSMPNSGSIVEQPNAISRPGNMVHREHAKLPSIMLAKEERTNNEDSEQKELDIKVRQKIKEMWRQNPRKKRQPVNVNKSKISLAKRPNKTSSGYLRNTPRPRKKIKEIRNSMGTKSSRKEDLKEVTQAWYAYYRKLKNYRKKYRRMADSNISETMARKKFMRNKKKVHPSKSSMTALKNKMDMKIDPPTTLMSTAVLQSPFEHDMRWKMSSRAHPTIPNSIRDIIHGTHLYTSPKATSNVNMMTKGNSNYSPATENVQKQVNEIKPSHPWKIHNMEKIPTSYTSIENPLSTSPHWSAEGGSSNSINKGFSQHNQDGLSYLSNSVEDEYEDDDVNVHVYEEILTPDWQNAYTDPASNHQSSSSKVNAYRIPSEVSNVGSRSINSHEVIDNNKNKNEHFSEESASPEPENKSYEYSP